MSEVMTQRTPEEIEALKREWRKDPIWDIEDTEGFEAHYDELRAYHAEMEAHWCRLRNQEETHKAEELGLPSNLFIGSYVLRLERRIAELEARVRRLED